MRATDDIRATRKGCVRKSVDEREDFLIIFTVGTNGYVCKNEGSTTEARALYTGTYRTCQIWIEKRGIAAALAHIDKYSNEVEELKGRTMTLPQLLTLLKTA